MPTLISGASRGSTVNQNGLKRDVLEAALNLDREKYPLMVLVRQFGEKIPQRRMKYEGRARARRQQVLTVTAVTAAAGTDVYVSAADGDLVNPMTDCYLWNSRTDELYLYQSESAGTVTVTGLSGTGGITFATVINDKLLILPESHAEGESVAGAYSQQESDCYNYLFQVDRGIETTDIQQLEEHYGSEDQRVADTAWAWVEEFGKINLVAYVGKRSLDTSSASARRRYMTRGLMEACQTNYVDMSALGGGLTYDLFCTLVEKAAKWGSAGQKIAMCGTNAMRNIAAWAEDKLKIDNLAKKYGVNIADVLTWSAGNVGVMYDPQLTSVNGMADRMFFIDKKHMRYCYMRPKKVEGGTIGGDLHLIRNYDTTNIHAFKDVITGIIGFRIGLEENFLYAFNVT